MTDTLNADPLNATELIVKEKREAEAAILAVVQKFEERTGLCPNAIDITMVRMGVQIGLRRDHGHAHVELVRLRVEL